MKLVGNLRYDYYDSVAKYGVDESIIYVRNNSQHVQQGGRDGFIKFQALLDELELSKLYSASGLRGNLSVKSPKGSFSVHGGVIGFCGKAYPVVALCQNRDERDNFVSRTKFCYSFDDFCSMADVEKKATYRKYSSLEEVREFFSRANELHVDESVFHSLGEPCFFVGDAPENTTSYSSYYSQIQINPRLQDFEFFRVKDAASAFQELTMFISGVLGQSHPPTAEISDEKMAEKKGFGHKYAFRKEPSKKRSR